MATATTEVDDVRGTVIKRGSKWSVVIDLGTDPATGKRNRKWHSGFATKREAEKARVKLLGELDNDAYVDPSKTTLGEYLLEDWLPGRKPTLQRAGRGHRGKVGIGTWESYRGKVTTYIVPHLGHVPLQSLTPSMLNRFYDELETRGRRDGAGLSPKTLANVHGVIHKALNDAVKRGLVSRNVADVVEKPKPGRAVTPEPWTTDELRRFLYAVRGDRLYAAWLLFATTGMRRGEVAGLAWEDIDLETGRLRISRTLGVVDNKPTWKLPKSEAGRRTMALDPATVAALKEHRARQNEERLFAGPAWESVQTDWRGESRAGVVFTWQDGSIIVPERWTVWFKEHCEAAGLRRIRLHDVRHAYATAALQHAKGWHDLKVISERLGHANVAITVDTYSHVLPAADEHAAHTLARVILGEG